MNFFECYKLAKVGQHFRRRAWPIEWYLWKIEGTLGFFGPPNCIWQQEMACQDWEIMQEC